MRLADHHDRRLFCNRDQHERQSVVILCDIDLPRKDPFFVRSFFVILHWTQPDFVYSVALSYVSPFVGEACSPVARRLPVCGCELYPFHVVDISSAIFGTTHSSSDSGIEKISSSWICARSQWMRRRSLFSIRMSASVAISLVLTAHGADDWVYDLPMLTLMPPALRIVDVTIIP